MTKSLWVRFRDYAENLFSAGAEAAAPIAEDVLMTTGKAVLAAAASGVDIDSHEMAKVALDSIHAQVPSIEARVSLAGAAMVLHDAKQGAVQAADAPLN